MIRAVLFDLDGTLLDRATSVRAYAEDQYLRFAEHFHDIPQAQYLERFLALDNKGYASKEIVFQSFLSEFNVVSLHYEELVRDFREQFVNHYTAFPNVHTTLRQLRSQGILLGLITNGGGDVQRKKLESLEIDQNFDVVLISELEGIKKPSPEIFHRALETLGVTAGQSLFVGDHPVVDIEGSRAVGMKALWKRTTDWDAPVITDAVIDDLSEVLLHLS